MAKPINMTPVIEGKDALKFHQTLKDSKHIETIRKNAEDIKKSAEVLRSRFKRG